MGTGLEVSPPETPLGEAIFPGLLGDNSLLGMLWPLNPFPLILCKQRISLRAAAEGVHKKKKGSEGHASSIRSQRVERGPWELYLRAPPSLPCEQIQGRLKPLPALSEAGLLSWMYPFYLLQPEALSQERWGQGAVLPFLGTPDRWIRVCPFSLSSCTSSWPS